MTDEPRLESFDLDHTKVRAPYVRVAGRYRGPQGDAVTKFDLRLVQPNRAEIPTAALHTIEHLMAGYMRRALEPGSDASVVDLSPMGCRTGFYLTLLGDPDAEVVRVATERALSDVAAHDGPIPGCSELECGNWRDHSLAGAKAWASAIVSGGFIVQETVPIVRN